MTEERKSRVHVVEADGRKFKYSLGDEFSFPVCQYCDLSDFCDRHPHVEHLCDAIENKNYCLKEMRMES